MKIKVLVVDDSAFMRKVICDILSTCDRINVVGTARNGNEAIEKTLELKPDVITLDVEMPVLDGISALKEIMRKTPTPVLMLSGHTAPGAKATITSLENGAVDFIPKPSSVLDYNADGFKKDLIEKVLIVSSSRLHLYRSRSRQAAPVAAKPQVSGYSHKAVKGAAQVSSKSGDGKLKKIIAIGTSTGGPKALQSVVPAFPADIEAGILIVQHMPVGFTKSMAERLDQLSGISVKEAEHGDVVKPGHAYVAPGGKQMRVERKGGEYRILVEDDGLVSGHRPSVDALMMSIADIGTRNVIGVIMTGMGADGAMGLVEMKKKNNAYIIAQDEESCVVYGMPKSAVEKGVVDKSVSLEGITVEILRAMEVQS